MMYQHSLPLTYFTWHSGVTRLVGGINGHQESGNSQNGGGAEEKKRKKWRGREKEKPRRSVRYKRRGSA